MPFLVEQKLNQGKLGEVILNALLQFETGIQGDLKDLSESLSTLNLIGLNNTARRAALTHLVLLNENNQALIENFLEAKFGEEGLSENTILAYSRDLEQICKKVGKSCRRFSERS